MGLLWGKTSDSLISAEARTPGTGEAVVKFDSINLETFTLVWFDDKVETTNENIALLTKLRASVNRVRIFTNMEACRIFIEAQSLDEPLVLVTSGKCGHGLVPLVHGLDQVNSIYIFCMDRLHHTTWANSYAKVLAVTDTANDLLDAIARDYRRRRQIEESVAPIIIFISKEQNSHKNLTSENGNFIYSQLLIETFLRMPHTTTSRRELMMICRRLYADNEILMKMINEFERNYSSDKAIWWYTRGTCFYQMLNKALRVQDIDTLFAFRFFITDIYKQLTALHARSDASPIVRVYRGQCLSTDELHRLHTSVGEFISMNSFLSTSLERKKTTAFLAQNNSTTEQSQHVLFEIDIDPSLETKPYADITAHSRFPEEREVLFMIGCIFRMRKIWREDHLWVVQLELCAERDQDSERMFSSLKENLGAETDLCSFGNLLFEMSEYEKSESYYQRLLNELPPTNSKTAAACHLGLGVIAKRRGEIDLALRHHEKSLQLSRAVPNNDQAIAASLHSLANEYKEKGDFTKALDYYTEARDIKFNLAGRETSDTASTYYHIARLYEKQKKHDEALKYYNKALAIQRECLLPDHHSIGKTYGCMGLVHFNVGDDNQALHFYEQSLEIKRKSLPMEHEFIGITYHDIGAVYERMNKYSLALTNLEKALEIYRLTLSPTHRRVINVETLMARIKEKIEGSNPIQAIIISTQS